MTGRKNHGNNAKRFDVNSFYSFLNKAHIRELLDNDGNTPYDSDSIDNSVWEYAAYLHKDIQDHGGRLSYFDSDSFRADSDGSGSNNWTALLHRDGQISRHGLTLITTNWARPLLWGEAHVVKRLNQWIELAQFCFNGAEMRHQCNCAGRDWDWLVGC